MANIMSDLIVSGINLMLTGMVTVLIFLSLLILLINISAAIFKDKLSEDVATNHTSSPDKSRIPDQHRQIINIINKRIFDE
jgi:Na+-transporting methylmalonyl-CoA/oxaloacetate decarboxylase gamma subunit